MIKNEYDTIYKKFKENTNKKNLRYLLKIPNYFNNIVKKISIGSRYGAPLERLEQIDESIQMIKKLYFLEMGEQCSESDLNDLLIYYFIGKNSGFKFFVKEY